MPTETEVDNAEVDKTGVETLAEELERLIVAHLYVSPTEDDGAYYMGEAFLKIKYATKNDNNVTVLKSAGGTRNVSMPVGVLASSAASTLYNAIRKAKPLMKGMMDYKFVIGDLEVSGAAVLDDDDDDEDPTLRA